MSANRYLLRPLAIQDEIRPPRGVIAKQNAQGAIDIYLSISVTNRENIVREALDQITAILSDDLESLKAAFEGCDAVFAVTDFWAACGLDPFKELQQGKKHLSVGTAAHQLLD